MKQATLEKQTMKHTVIVNKDNSKKSVTIGGKTSHISPGKKNTKSNKNRVSENENPSPDTMI